MSLLSAAAVENLLSVLCFVCSHGSLETLARDIFTEVGDKLQQRRLKDFIQNFGCHLTDEYRYIN